MKRATSILVFILISLNIFSQEVKPRIMESLSMHSNILNKDIKYSICLPENYYKSKKPFPVVYLLHGLGDDETAWIEYGCINQIADKAVKDGEIVPMIFVIPQGFRTYYVNDYAGKFPYQDMFIKELIPFIDKQYKTIPDANHRATLGYSMGGFGALILPLKNPDIIGTCVPLSISIRTDEQYMVEDASEWDKQWGSLFGGVGKTGVERLTDYFKQNYPFHIFQENDLSKLNNLKIYIDNGDDEHTLCRSNEELHILMSDKGIQHQFRVRNGGHEFSYWRDAVPNGLRFISDAFESKSYRGDIKQEVKKTTLKQNQLISLSIKETSFNVFVPDEYNYSTRLYPVVYFAGNLNSNQKRLFSEVVNYRIQQGEICPMLLVFLNNSHIITDSLLNGFENKLRIRDGYKFRSLIGYQDRANEVLCTELNKNQFGSCILSDPFLQKDSIVSLTSNLNSESLKKIVFYFDSPDKGKFYLGNGNLHMVLRDKDIQHEYRVREGNGGFDWMIENLPEILDFVQNRFHR
ncbi:MAG: esterase family protein [Bacteroidales bacterium]|nr:esterase family protein [Bacteroidales bacterium]